MFSRCRSARANGTMFVHSTTTAPTSGCSATNSSRDAAMRRQFALIDRQKPAARGDPVGAVLHQLGAGREEGVEQSGRAVVRPGRRHSFAGGAAQDLI